MIEMMSRVFAIFLVLCQFLATPMLGSGGGGAGGFEAVGRRVVQVPCVDEPVALCCGDGCSGEMDLREGERGGCACCIEKAPPPMPEPVAPVSVVAGIAKVVFVAPPPPLSVGVFARAFLNEGCVRVSGGKRGVSVSEHLSLVCRWVV